ncbi:hypothetical protein B0I73DRAFT_33764 [Yarrowia lipolytica]|uniref:K Homology domain-containing protein n=1 Tax=Yarrowia lipolytica TaxID=4952 RepID=A0A371C7V0_YARLL|nr:hypothetical protein B0I71DRAFT_32451 [Yarrowia lipolytica]RDW39505.1 hypothetical protein B0I73DRAFT_33764 [Yarrowia lipolytica]RDW47232.1 hypothetical protein B0I74DRAFT_20101 [Yarrowia lipolytica]RDW53325.1 hypothetical protein B0I75DRAFT_24604 [Yarrowia lipolytica]
MSFNHYRSSRSPYRDRYDSWMRDRHLDRQREVSPHRTSRNDRHDRPTSWDTKRGERRDEPREYREYGSPGDSLPRARERVGRSPRSPRDIRRLSDCSRMSDSRIELDSPLAQRRHSSIAHEQIVARDNHSGTFRRGDRDSTSSRTRVSRFDAVDPVAVATSIAAKINAGLMARDLAYRKQQTDPARQMDEEDAESRNEDSSSSSASKLSMGSMGSEDTSGYDSPQPVPKRPIIKMTPRCVKSPSPQTETLAAPAVAEAEPTHYTRDVDINGFRSKHLLTKSSTQAEIQATTGCSVTSRGRFMDKGEIPGDEKPLHLHLEGPTTESIAAAVNKIQSILHQDMYDDHRNPAAFYRNVSVVNNSGLTPFQLRGLVVGPQGQNIKHIQQASGCRIQIKGIGSRYMEGEVEEQVPLYVNVSGHDEASVDIAEHLIMDLMRVVESSAHKRYRMSKR